MAYYRNSVPRIGWGPYYSASVYVDIPLDNAVTYSQPRFDTLTAMTPAGIEDAWVVEEDQMLAGTMRFIPQTRSTSPVRVGWDDPEGWGALLNAPREWHYVRWYPDSRNWIDGPSMAIDANNTGVADDFALTVSAGVLSVPTMGTGSVLTQSLYAKNTSTPGDKFVELSQPVYGFRPGEVLTLSFDGAHVQHAGTSEGRVFLAPWDGSGYVSVQSVVFANSPTFSRYIVPNVTVPTGSVRVDVLIRSRVPAVNDEGTVRVKNLMLSRTGDTTFVDNPMVPCNLMLSTGTGVTLEANGERSVEVLLRASGSGVFSGY